jgi:hypothetical protein
MRLTVGPENYRNDLVGAAEAAWRAFEAAVGEIPFAFTPPPRFDWNARTAEGIAKCFVFGEPQRPQSEFALIVLSVGFFDKPANERNLTLLHESIHLRFMSGPLRARVTESERLDRVHRLPHIDDQGEYRFRSLRLGLACYFRNFADEILAELYLKTYYPAFLQGRVGYYLGMRRASFEQSREPDVPSTLRPYTILYEMLRNDLGVRLAEGYEQAAEFAAMSAALEHECRAASSEREFARHMETRRRLMEVTLEPLAFDEAAYEETFTTVLGLLR